MVAGGPGVEQKGAVTTEMTFAFFEDTGWYRANYAIVGVSEWGLHLGRRSGVVGAVDHLLCCAVLCCATLRTDFLKQIV